MPDTERASRLKTRIAAAAKPGPDSLRVLAVAVVVIAGLYLAREVLVPITLAVMLSFVLAPLVGWLRHRGLWRVPSVLLSVLLALGVIGGLGFVIGGQIATLGSRASLYAYTIQQKIQAVQQRTTDEITSLQERMGHGAPAPAGPAATAPGDAPKPVAVAVVPPVPSQLEVLREWAMPVVGPLSTLGIVLVVAIFILLQKEDLRDRLIRLFGSGDLHRTTAAMDEAATRLSRYFLTQLAVNAGFGVTIGVGLFFIGVPSPALFGILGTLLRFVPYVGAIGAALLPIGLAAGVEPGWTMVMETAALFVVVEALTGQVLEPLLYGHNTGLSPVSVVVAAVFWGWLWGPVGLILSMPLTLCLVVLGRHFRPLQFIDVMLGDQPVLTPGESFYQRMLAGDSDEVVDQAEAFLKDRPLSAYYDEVALPGLHMAANDAQRGVLTTEQLDNVQDSVGAVLLDLVDHPDTGLHADLADARPPARVLCVGGRGPLDELVCAAVAQLLAKRGVQSRTATRGDVARGAVEALDVAEVGVVVVSWLEGPATLPSLRHVVRRLQGRMPGVPVVLGVWQMDLGGENLARLQAAIPSEHCATMVSGAVDACVRLACAAVTEVGERRAAA